MTNKELLEAIGEIDAGAVLDAREGGAERKTTLRGRKFISVMVAAVLVVAMAVSTVAYYGAGDRFKAVFDQWGGDQSEGQNAFIEGAAVDVGESVTRKGYTITVAGTISDGKSAIIQIDLAAAEDQSVWGAGFWEYALSRGGEELNKGWSMGYVDDGDGKDNTLTMILSTSIDSEEVSLANGAAWTLRLTDLCMDSEDGYMENKLVEGDWYFEVTFSDVSDEVELITEPVTFEGKTDSGETVSARLISMTLSALTLEYSYTFESETASILCFEEVSIVMKDGHVVHNGSGWGDGTGARHILLQPIDLSEVDYILFADGVKIPVVSE